MPKMKTNRAAAKRFKKTASGKFKFSHEGRRHNMSSKNPKRFRRLEIDGIVANGQARRLRRLLPYE